MIGRNVDEATSAVEKFIDRAFLAGLTRVRIVHGSGMGILRKALRQYLQKHPHVATVAEPQQNEGGAGATVVSSGNSQISPGARSRGAAIAAKLQIDANRRNRLTSPLIRSANPDQCHRVLGGFIVSFPFLSLRPLRPLRLKVLLFDFAPLISSLW